MLFARAHHDSILGRRAVGLALSASLHALLMALSAWPPPAATSQPETTAAAAATMVQATSASRIADDLRLDEGGATESRPALEVAGVSIDFDRILKRRDDLFPFLSLDAVGLLRTATTAEARRHLVNPLAVAASRGSGKPTLRLSRNQLQRLVDRAWSRQRRWRPFAPIAALIETHDPNAGSAAVLLKAYSDQNLLQPYYDADTRDPRYWTMLALAADHGTFIAMVRRVAAQHGASRVTTELLFLLEELAQGSRDTLLMLMATDPYRDLRRTAADLPRAHSLAVSLFNTYRSRLEGRGLDSPAAIRLAYDRIRLQLLATIVATTPAGYRSADARYLAGVIHAEQHDLSGAERWWRTIQSADAPTCFEACADVLAALELPPERRAAAIAAALGAAHRRWLDHSEARLRQFGHSSDAY